MLLRLVSLTLKDSVDVNSNFSKHFKLILAVQSRPEKYFASPFPQISCFLVPIPPRQEGRFAIVTIREAGCDGRDASEDE